LFIVGLNPPGFTLATENAMEQFLKEKGIIKDKGEGGSIQFIENAESMACVRSYWVMGVP
jgi:hypothetical protein